MVQPYDIHDGYTMMVMLGMAVTLAFPSTKYFANPHDKRRYWSLQIITAVAAVIGAKVAVLFGDALWPLRPFHDWQALLGSGRSIVGALLFGFIAAEAAKPLLRYDIPPNDRFAIILPFSIGIGRFGCFLAGCCRGIPYNGPLAITYSDGIPRHPAQLYEMAFHLIMGMVLIVLYRRQILFGRLFALYLVSYGVYRFFSEFIRETAKPFDGLSAYQWMCILMVIVGGIALIVRSRRQPESWQSWRLAARGEPA